MATMNPFNVGKATPNTFGSSPASTKGGSVAPPVVKGPALGAGGPAVGPTGGPLVSQPVTGGGAKQGFNGPALGAGGPAVGPTGAPLVSQPPTLGRPGQGMDADRQKLESLGNALFKQYGSDEGAMAQDPRYAEFLAAKNQLAAMQNQKMQQPVNQAAVTQQAQQAQQAMKQAAAAQQTQQMWDAEAAKRQAAADVAAASGMTPR